MSERAEPDELDAAGGPAVDPPDAEPHDAQELQPVQRIVPAADADRLHVLHGRWALRAPVSIFNVETAADMLAKCRAGRVPPPEPLYVPQVERTHGVVRLVRVRVEDTAEWQAKEQARRAKQRPPKPCAAMRRRKSEKLRKLLGLDLDHGD